MSESQIIGFKIDGDWMTSFARRRAYEEHSWDKRCEELGCIKITTGLSDSPAITMARKRPSKAQWGTAFTWCILHEVTEKDVGLISYKSGTPEDPQS